MAMGKDNFERLRIESQADIESADEVTMTFDWSGYDKRIQVWLINHAFDVVWSLID